MHMPQTLGFTHLGVRSIIQAMKNSLEQTDLPLARKLMHAFKRVQVATRAGDWEEFGQRGLNPTQGQILILLYERADGLRVSEIAEELMVSAPAVSDSVRVLTDKGYVNKTKITEDERQDTRGENVHNLPLLSPPRSQYADRPHHCALVDAAFGDRTVRSDCPDHEAATREVASSIEKLGHYIIRMEGCPKN